MKKILKFSLNGFKNDFLYKTDMRFNQNLSKPTIICFQNTYKCNFRCKQCGLWKAPSKELNTSQWKKIIFDLRKWIGPFYISIAGGEPFIRKDTLELVKFSNKLGIITDIITNGSLIDDKLAKRIIKSGLDKITFSLDGANPNTHDNIRKFNGSFNHTMRAIKILQSLSPRLNISVNTVITSKNLEELKDLVNLVVKNNLNGIYFRALICKDLSNNYNNDSYSKSTLWPRDYDKACKAIDELIKLKSLGYPVSNSVKHLQCIKQYLKNPYFEFKSLTCLRPVRYLAVLPDGQARICDKSIGNLLHSKPWSLWYSRNASEIRRQKRVCHRSCILKNPGDIGDSLNDTFKMFYRGLKNKLRF